jgi:hypothetical protein
MTEINRLSSGDLLQLADGELVLVEEIHYVSDETAQLQLADGAGSSWKTAPMRLTARIQGRVDRR